MRIVRCGVLWAGVWGELRLRLVGRNVNVGINTKNFPPF